MDFPGRQFLRGRYSHFFYVAHSQPEIKRGQTFMDEFTETISFKDRRSGA
jgi:hypothetical protein